MNNDWLADSGFLYLDRQIRIEYQCLLSSNHAADDRESTPALILLHEGLGCVALWKTFPDRLWKKLNTTIFSYSRQGYGSSSASKLPLPTDYMQREARSWLPVLIDQVLDRIPQSRYILVGHSDGASIAACYAAIHDDPRLAGLALVAPHFYVEPIAISAIRDARRNWQCGDLRTHLQKYHGSNVDSAFLGWNDTWLSDTFRYWDIRPLLTMINVPVLGVQGIDDPYGTIEQLYTLQAQCAASVMLEVIAACDHSPHLEKPDQLITALDRFISSLVVSA